MTDLWGQRHRPKEKRVTEKEREESKYTAAMARLIEGFQRAGYGSEILTAYLLKCLHRNTQVIITAFSQEPVNG